MTNQNFENVIKKDIRNNPIIREVDQTRQREMWRSVAIGVFLVVVLIFSAWQHFELLQHGYYIEEMQQERARELEINRHLKLEIETLQSLDRIEKIATEQLDLVAPTESEAIVLQRVVPAVQPDQSIVATHQEIDSVHSQHP